MLTRCIEKGREKCDHYWPYDTEPVYYGDIQVTILNESHFPDWNINEFRMMRGDTVRKIKHFHFTTWPDFGVPEPPQTLVRFYSLISCSSYLVFFFRNSTSSCVRVWDTFLPFFLYFPVFPLLEDPDSLGILLNLRLNS